MSELAKDFIFHVSVYTLMFFIVMGVSWCINKYKGLETKPWY
jgi:hypothetical protein